MALTADGGDDAAVFDALVDALEPPRTPGGSTPEIIAMHDVRARPPLPLMAAVMSLSHSSLSVSYETLVYVCVCVFVCVCVCVCGGGGQDLVDAVAWELTDTALPRAVPGGPACAVAAAAARAIDLVARRGRPRELAVLLSEKLGAACTRTPASAAAAEMRAPLAMMQIGA